MVKNVEEAKKEYAKLSAEYSLRAAANLAWCMEWYPEAVPLEDKDGAAMRDHVQKIITANVGGLPEYQHVRDKKNTGPKEYYLEQVPKPKRESVLIFPDSMGVCQGIVDNAPQGRIGHLHMVDTPYEELTEDAVESLLNDKEGGWDMVIFGSGLDFPESCAVHHVLERDNIVSRLYFWIAQTCSKDDDRENCKRIAVLTRGTFAEEPEVHEEAGLGLITNHTLFGMCNTIRMELNIPVQYIDIDWSIESLWWQRKRNQTLMTEVASECFRLSSFGHNTVRLLHKGRYVMRQLPLDDEYLAEDKEFHIPTEGIIMISGGNGALGLVMGNWLLDNAGIQNTRGITIQFLSRSCKITDQNMPNWKEIQRKAAALDITVEQVRGDLSSQAAVDQIVASADGKLAGFIHSAGVLRDSLLSNLTWPMFEEVYDSKHRPALYLHDAMERMEQPLLEFFWTFSSTSVYGNPGQTNYSGSNCFQDALTRHRRSLGLPGTTIQWGAWGEVGMAANLDEASKRRFESGPQPPFTNAQGLAGLERGLATGLPYFTVFRTNPVAMVGMVQHNNNVSSTYQRNLTSEVYPTPLPDGSIGYLYSMLRQTQWPYREKKAEKLVYDTYVKVQKERLAEPDEDGLVWA